MAEGGFINLCDFDDDIGKDFDIKKPLDNKIMKLKVDLNILIERLCFAYLRGLVHGYNKIDCGQI